MMSHGEESKDVEDSSSVLLVNDGFTPLEDKEIIFTDSVSNMSMGAESFSTIHHVEGEKLSLGTSSLVDASVYIDEETRMFTSESPGFNSPQDIVSPVDRGEVSSPFSAMESDGMETGYDDVNLSTPGEIISRPRGFFGASTPLECTTTPGGSSSGGDDDYEESSGSRNKRRRTRRDLHPSCTISQFKPGNSNYHFAQNPSPSADACHESAFSPPLSESANFSLGQQVDGKIQFRNEKQTDSTNVFEIKVAPNIVRPTPVRDNKLMLSNQSGDAASNEDSKPIKTNSGNAGNSVHTSAPRRRHFTHRVSTSDSEQTLHRQYPSKIDETELVIVSQPETQHRARYLTEGSRGPVKDSSQQGFPKIQLKGYDAPATLQVFVGTDAGKVRPHAFYQACRVTGRSTSQCEEREIEGTKVIEIPFKAEDSILSIDCVGILKLRNTDVEARIGVRNQKRNQSVRLVFRVCLNKTTHTSKDHQIILQVASVRINCTQPLGQPEIVKKSLDKCPVEGDVEMFIIGKNFHRGTTVIYQDPEESDGSQWQAEGKVDKDTFHQTHMVVRVPPYHDLQITKPVNVQILVKYQGRSCEPHSFTYTPSQSCSGKESMVNSQLSSMKPEPADSMLTEDSSTGNESKIENRHSTGGVSLDAPVKSILEGPIDKKFLLELFSKLVTSVDSQSRPESSSVQALVPEEIAVKNNSHSVSMDSVTKSQFPIKPSDTINFQSVNQEPVANFTDVFTPEVVSNEVMNNDRVDVIPASEIQLPNPQVANTFAPSGVNVKTESPNMLENVLFYSATSINSSSSTSSNVYSLPGMDNSSNVCPSTIHSIPGSNFFNTNSSQTFVSQNANLPLSSSIASNQTFVSQNANLPLSSSIASNYSVANVTQQVYDGFNVPVPEQMFVNNPQQGAANPIKQNILIGSNVSEQPIPVPTVQQTLQVQTLQVPADIASTNPSQTISQPELQCYPQYSVGNLPLLQDQPMFDTTKQEPSISTLDVKINNDSFASSFPCPADDFFEVNNNANLEVTNQEVAMQVINNPIPPTVHPVTHLVDTTTQKISHAETLQPSNQYQILSQEHSGVVLQPSQHAIPPNESVPSLMNQTTNEQILPRSLPNVLKDLEKSDFRKDKIPIDQPIIHTESLRSNTASLVATPIISAPLLQLSGPTTCASGITASPAIGAMFGGNEVMKMSKPAESSSELPFEHTPPDFFAMHQLLHSIGTENLATITGEDVQEQLQ